MFFLQQDSIILTKCKMTVFHLIKDIIIMWYSVELLFFFFGRSIRFIWVIRTRTGKKLDKCHSFFKSQRLLRIEKSKNSYTFKSYYLILALGVLRIWVSGLRRNLGWARYAQSWVFFQHFQNTAFFVAFLLG